MSITRRVDDLGRVVLPKEHRQKIGIQERDAVDIEVDGDRIILTKNPDPCGCSFCGKDSEILKNFKGYNICPDCVAEFKNL